MNTADKIYSLVKHLPESQARNILDFVEFIYVRFRQLSSPASTAKDRATSEPGLSPNTANGQTTAIGLNSLDILQRNGFIGSLPAEPELSSRYKEELDWSQKSNF